MAGGHGTGMPVGKPVPVGRGSDPGAAADSPLVDREQGDAVPVGDGGVQADGAGRGTDLDHLAGKHPRRGDRVQVRLERDQAVLADVPQVPVRDDIRPGRDRGQRGVVTLRAGPDDLAVRAVDRGAADRHPGKERAVQRVQRGERPASQHVIADDQHLPLDPALPRRPVGGQHIDVEAVVPGERRSLRVQRDRLARRDMPPDHGPGPVVDDHPGHAAEVGERPPVARPERRQVLAGREAAERVPRVRQHHVEGVAVRDPGIGEDAVLVTPVDLGLRSRDHLEPAVQPRQLRRRVAQLRRDPGPGLLQVHLDPLVVRGEPVLPGQPLVDDGALQQDLRAQPRVDHRGIRRDDLLAPARARRRLRRHGRAVFFQVLLDGPPVKPGLPGDLRESRPRLAQRPEPAQLKPPLRFQYHPAAPARDHHPNTGETPTDHDPLPGDTPRSLHVHVYPALHMNSYTDREWCRAHSMPSSAAYLVLPGRWRW